jgi:tRNA(adenine34) deaminase
MASIWAEIERIVYGAGRNQVHSSYFEGRHLNVMDFISDAFRQDIELRGGVLAEECAVLYIPPERDVPKSEQFNL